MHTTVAIATTAGNQRVTAELLAATSGGSTTASTGRYDCSLRFFRFGGLAFACAGAMQYELTRQGARLANEKESLQFLTRHYMYSSITCS
eukprot:6963956-Prymnesium_polylepis.2